MTEPVVSARDIALRRDERTVLGDVSLTVDVGERALVRGPSGSGKTTLFSVLGLLEPPTDGTLAVAGTRVDSCSERTRARVRRESIGIVFQDFQLVPDLTAIENAAMPQEHAGARDPVWLATLFERLQIAELVDRYPGTLSGGEKQRVAIARALANRPAVILADEPTGQLDSATADRVLSLFERARESTDAALVLVSHDRSIADRFDSCYRLVDGRLTAEGAQEGREHSLERQDDPQDRRSVPHAHRDDDRTRPRPSRG